MVKSSFDIFWYRAIWLSYSLFRKSKEDKEGLRIYGAFGYGGVALLSGEQIRSLDIMYHILGGIVLLH